MFCFGIDGGSAGPFSGKCGRKRGTGTIPGRRLGIDGLLGDGEGMVTEHASLECPPGPGCVYTLEIEPWKSLAAIFYRLVYEPPFFEEGFIIIQREPPCFKWWLTSRVNIEPKNK